MESNRYYRVSLNSPPRLHYLKTYRESDFRYFGRSRNPRGCEIVLVEEGVLQETQGGTTTLWESGTVHTLLKDRDFLQASDSPVYQPFEIGLFFDSPVQTVTQEELLRWIPADNEAILLPEVRNPKTAAVLASLIKQAVAAYTSMAPDRFLAVRGILYELFRTMTNCALDEVRQKQEDPARQLIHCRRACAYITANLAQPLSVRHVAKALGISANYLSKLFPPVMHMSVTEYIHRAKIQQAAHLITDGQMTLSAAAEAVGIGDSKYLSRLFRRYMGTSAANYRKLYR